MQNRNSLDYLSAAVRSPLRGTGAFAAFKNVRDLNCYHFPLVDYRIDDSPKR